MSFPPAAHVSDILGWHIARAFLGIESDVNACFAGYPARAVAAAP